MSHPDLGKLIEGPADRDAIHIAVAPVIATEELEPGDEIGFVGASNEQVGYVLKPIGIVDPFLKGQVYTGQRFWMFMFPQTTTGLRHEWSHPAFTEQRTTPDERKVEAEEYLRRYAQQHCPYDEGGKAFINFIRNAEQGYIYYHGRDCHGWGDVEDADTLLFHLSIFLGKPITRDGVEPTCSC